MESYISKRRSNRNLLSSERSIDEISVNHREDWPCREAENKTGNNKTRADKNRHPRRRQSPPICLQNLKSAKTENWAVLNPQNGSDLDQTTTIRIRLTQPV